MLFALSIDDSRTSYIVQVLRNINYSIQLEHRHPARIIIIGASSAGRKGDTHIYREMNSDPLRIDSGKNLKNLKFIFRITLLWSGVACK